MTGNRLIDAVGQPARKLEVGETRTIHVKDKDGAILRTLTVHRTDRPYVYDLCDAYNVQVTNGLQWFVDPGGNLRLGEPGGFSERRTREMERISEDERHRWQTRQLEPA